MANSNYMNSGIEKNPNNYPCSEVNDSRPSAVSGGVPACVPLQQNIKVDINPMNTGLEPAGYQGVMSPNRVNGPIASVKSTGTGLEGGLSIDTKK